MNTSPAIVLPIADERKRAERFYWRSYGDGALVDSVTGPTEGLAFVCINTSDASGNNPLSVPMRVTPSVSLYSTGGGAGAGSARNNAAGTSVTGLAIVDVTNHSIGRINKNASLGALGTPFSAHAVADADL